MKAKIMQALLTAILLLGFCEVNTLTARATGTPVLDQYNSADLETVLLGVSDTSSVWQQGVTAGMAGSLSSVSIRIFDPGSFNFFVNLGTPWQSDANDFQTYISTTARGWLSIDVSSANIQLQQGDHFVIGVAGVGDANRPYLTAAGDSYSGGIVWGALTGGGNMSFPDWDMGFQTFMIVAVPEPGTFALAGLGSAALMISRRRR